MKAFKSVLILAFLLLILFSSAAFADSTPVIISFQGQLRENSVPVSGNRTMHFRILDVSSNVIWQSNASLATQVTVAVSNGIYTVGLGDTSLTNMAALTSVDLDKNIKLFLRVRVGTEDLAPDILLSAVPFAYIAKQAETITQNITAGNSVALALRRSTQNVGLFNANPTGIFQVSSNYLFVSSNGNIGVSTTNPQEILDVTGRVRLGQGTAPGTTTDRLYNVGGNLFWNGVTLNTISSGNSQWTTTSSAAIFYSSGNVGIGTNAPMTDLEIRKDAASALGPILSLTNYPGGGGAAGAIDFHTYVLGPDQPEVRILANDNNYSADLIFYTKVPGAQGNPLAERMRILNNGNIGIANAAPTGLFQISSNYFFVSSNGNIGVSTTNPQEILDVTGRVRLGQTTAPSTTTDKLYNVSGNLFWNGVTLNSGAVTNYWSVNGSNVFYPSGNVGVSSTAPANLFQVSTNFLVVSGNGKVGIGNSSPTGLFQVSTNYLIVSSNGRVGIGNNNPSNLFQVSTNAFVVSTNGNIGVSTTNTLASIVIDGGIVVAPSTTVSLTADDTLITVGNRSFIVISSNSGTATARTFCLTAGRTTGHILYVLNNNNGNSAQLVDGAQSCPGAPVNANLNGSYSFSGGGDTLSLIYDGTAWNELSRGAN